MFFQYRVVQKLHTDNYYVSSEHFKRLIFIPYLINYCETLNLYFFNQFNHLNHFPLNIKEQKYYYNYYY